MTRLLRMRAIQSNSCIVDGGVAVQSIRLTQQLCHPQVAYRRIAVVSEGNIYLIRVILFCSQPTQANVPHAITQHSHRTQIPPPSRANTSNESRPHPGQRTFVSPNRLFSRPNRSPNNSDPNNRILQTSLNSYGFSAGVKIGRPNDPSYLDSDTRGGAFSRPVL